MPRAGMRFKYMLYNEDNELIKYRRNTAGFCKDGN